MSPTNDAPPLLTPRQLEIIGLLAQGLSHRQVSTQLVVSLTTTKAHTKEIRRKLNARNLLQAVLKAMALGLVPPPPLINPEGPTTHAD